MKNRYVNRSKISESKFRELVRFFALDLTAVQIAKLTGLNRNTVNRYLTEIRKKISLYSMLTSPIASAEGNPFPEPGEEEGFDILIKEMEGRIYTRLVARGSNGVQIPFVQSGESKDAFFDLRIDLRTDTHHFIGEEGDGRSSIRARINRIESFWSSTKSRLAKFKGMRSSTYRYHLKECEFRYNNRGRDLYPLLLSILRKYPLF